MRQPCLVDKPVNQGQHLIIPKADGVFRWFLVE